MKTYEELKSEKAILEEQFGYSVRKIAENIVSKEFGMFASICGFNVYSMQR